MHTIIRPIGGALIAVASIGTASPTTQAIVGLAGAALATSSHLTKAGTRALANTSPEPFSNWTLSLLEDGFVVASLLSGIHSPPRSVLACVLIVGSVLARGVLRRRATRNLGRDKTKANASLAANVTRGTGSAPSGASQRGLAG